MKPNPKRRVHLGLLRTERTGRSFERFFRWEMDSLPEEVEAAIARGPVPAHEALQISEVSRLLDPGYLAMENGYARLDDGMITVAVRTDFPGATPQMIDWWFGWHGDETDRYKLWHPQAHLYTEWKHPRPEVPAGDPAKYIDNTSWVDEYVGPAVNRLAIQFKSPATLGLDASLFVDARVGTAVCARVGASDAPLDLGWLVHLMRETETGCEMRSRFWLGDIHVRGMPSWNPVDLLMKQPAMRRRAAGDEIGKNLLIHCAEEMNHLAGFLPELHAQETA